MSIKTIEFKNKNYPAPVGQNDFIHNDSEVLIGENDTTFKELPIQTNETLVATARLGSDADRGLGSLAATANVGAAITTLSGEDYYDVTGDIGGKSWSFDGANVPSGQTMTIRFKVIPQYNGGGSATNKYLFSLTQASGFSNIFMFHQSTQNIQIRINNDAGGIASVINFAGWNAVANQEYEFELDMNFSVANNIRLFIDGVQFGADASSLVTRVAVDNFEISSSVISSKSDFLIRDVELFNTIQHTSDFAGEIPRAVAIYPLESFIEPQDFSVAEGLHSLAQSLVSSGSATVNYVLKSENQYFYMVGNTVTVSDKTLAQSNTVAIWNDPLNVAAVTAVITAGARITFCPVVSSGLGIDNLALTSTTTDYNFFAVPLSCIQSTMYGFVNDNCVDIISGTARFYVDEPFEAQGNTISFDDTVAMRPTDGGFYEYPVVIPDSDNPVEYNVALSWIDIDSKAWTKDYVILVPSASSSNVINIRVEE